MGLIDIDNKYAVIIILWVILKNFAMSFFFIKCEQNHKLDVFKKRILV